jgi:hypothetical protein
MDVGPKKGYILQFLSAAFANSDEIERPPFSPQKSRWIDQSAAENGTLDPAQPSLRAGLCHPGRCAGLERPA